MANEITVTQSLAVENGNHSHSDPPIAKQYDQTTASGTWIGAKSIGTGETTVSLSDLTTPGWCKMTNLDATNYVQWGFSTGVYGGRLEAGESALFRLDPGLASIFCLANTAACDVEFEVMED